MNLVRYIVAVALVLAPFLNCDAKEKDDKVLCAKLKNELRAKYKLPAKADNTEELEDTRSLVKQLESKLDQKRKDKETASSSESKEQAMNRRMEIGNLEYEIDNLSDFIPEIKAKKDEGRERKKSEQSALRNDRDDYQPLYSNVPFRRNYKE
ncbi:MAG: hypothetical protein SFY67_16410 [Candidatus Melainabacteria bacterium]|nr:hypothetical protein [Candidatus Melainabacteria bacterium]